MARKQNPKYHPRNYTRLFITVPPNEFKRAYTYSHKVNYRISSVVRALLEIWQTGALDGQIDEMLKASGRRNTRYGANTP